MNELYERAFTFFVCINVALGLIFVPLVAFPYCVVFPLPSASVLTQWVVRILSFLGCGLTVCAIVLISRMNKDAKRLGIEQAYLKNAGKHTQKKYGYEAK
jgi:hypothetical protein